jgi:large subunit ribosomal protein L10
MTVSEVEELRAVMREAGTGYKVTKNRLARLALKGTQYEGLVSEFTGPTAIATSLDPVATAKATVEFANKNDKFSIVAGAIGSSLLSPAEVKFLSNLPSIDELRAKLVGLLQAPLSRIVGVLPAPAENLARVMPAPGSKVARVFAARGQQG